MQKLLVVTHDGTFHTDDVFACATLSLAFKDREIEIVRSRDEAMISRGNIVFDVGGSYDPQTGRFDHHQKGGAGERDNHMPYASFGLVWKEYGHIVAGSVAAQAHIDEWLVQCIDAPDNGIGNDRSGNKFYEFNIGDVITAERPTWQEGFSMDEGFIVAVKIAMRVLLRAVAQTNSYFAAQELLEKAFMDAPDKRIVELAEKYPGWYEYMAKHSEVLFILYPRENKKGWAIRGARNDPQKFDVRKPLPKSWAGLRDSELQTISGVPDAIFCHKDLFTASALSRSGALALAEKAIAD